MVSCVVGVVRRTASRTTKIAEGVSVVWAATHADVGCSVVIARIRGGTSSNVDTLRAVRISCRADALTLEIDAIGEIARRTNQHTLFSSIVSKIFGIIARRLALVS